MDDRECCLDGWRIRSRSFRLFGWHLYVALYPPAPSDLPDCNERHCNDSDYYY